MILSSLVLSLALALPAPPHPGNGTGADFEELLRNACETYGLDREHLEGVTLDQVLAGDRFLRVELGPFDVRLPVQEVTQKAEAELVCEATGVLLRTLSTWAHWTLVEDEAREQAFEDVEVLLDWVGKWSARGFKKAAKSEGDSLFERMSSADDEVRAAGDRLVRALSPRADPDFPGPPALLVLTPSRKAFTEMLALVGELEPSRKDVLWTDAAISNAANWSEKAQIVALQYAIWPWDPRLPYEGQSMNIMHRTGLEQHVVDRAGAALTRAAFNQYASPVLEAALRTNLVIDVVGDNSLTFGIESFQWSRAGGSTSPYSRFVPGGNSKGGTLPARKASSGGGARSSSGSSVWRENDGEDHFLEPLRKGQKAGAKLAARDHDLTPAQRGDKTSHFEIHGESKGHSLRMTAPFLGDEAEGKQTPPDEFIDDYEEFFRAYRAGFFYWLQTEGNPDGEEASAASFARLLRRARHREKLDTLSSMVHEVYGVPLSGPDGETDSLEWRFLAHVAK